MCLRNYVNHLGVWLTFAVLGGCSTWQQDLISGEPFQHQTAYRAGPAATGPIHIYIHGDGRPFITPSQVAADPSPGRPYVLKLMAMDPASSVLLGRPCYFRARAEDRCHFRWWTTHRYARSVVDSMAAGANQLADGRDVVLIGYSGGGTLAMLMAPAIRQLKGVVTIAANLDTDQWTTLHGYTPLHGSLNPSRELERLAAIPQVHYLGVDDEVVPAALAEGFKARLPPGSVQLIPGQDHDCCWHKQWPELLNRALNRF